jgi:hypothetical protein
MVNKSLNAAKRRAFISITGLTSAVLLAGCAARPGAGAAPKAEQPAFAPGSVYSYSSAWEQMLSSDAGNSYAIDGDGKVTVSYDHGENTATAPFTVQKDAMDNAFESFPGAFISENKTAFAYGDFDGASPLKIYTSDDMGGTWQTSELTLPGIAVARSYIGFSTESDGWLVACNWHAMTYEDNYIYKTSDGGRTWTASDGNQNDVYPSLVTGAGFSAGNTAFLCFWYYEKDFEPPVIRSLDGGKTWEKLFITLPADYDKYSKTALSPVFDGADGTLPVLLSDGGASAYAGVVYLKTTDYGKTWSFDGTSGTQEVPPVVAAPATAALPSYQAYALTNKNGGPVLHPGLQDGAYPWGMSFDVSSQSSFDSDMMSYTSGDMPEAVIHQVKGDQFRLFYRHIKGTGKDVISSFMTTSDAYETERGIKRGDALDKLLEAYGSGLLWQPEPFPLSRDYGGDFCVYDELFIYTRPEDDNCSLLFYVVDDPDGKFITGIQTSLGQDGIQAFAADNTTTFHVDYSDPDKYLKTDTTAEERVHELMKAQGPVGMTTILRAMSEFNWRIYSELYRDDIVDVMNWLYEQTITEDEDIMLVLKTTDGLDGAFSETYSDVIAKIYKADSQEFIKLAGRLDDSQIDNIARHLCYGLSDMKDQVVQELKKYVDSDLTPGEVLVIQDVIYYFDTWY